MASERNRLPSNFDQARLLAQDFDGTIAQTFEKSPRGIGVHEAYEEAIDACFGAASVDAYRRNGGLRNRAPVEVVVELTGDASQTEITSMTDRLIVAKLAVLTGEIGTSFSDGSRWPRPTEGYLELKGRLEIARANGRNIDDIVISSGHEPFIARVFDSWGVPQPDFVIAEETTRRLAGEFPEEDFVKPSAVLMQAGINMWRGSYGVGPAELAFSDAERVLYVGDDVEKDQTLAANSATGFVLVRPDQARADWQQIGQLLDLPEVA